ncbi:hypothetical protein JANAI62_18640 [Jannaschia pagri]|uniref:Glycosyl transferase family 2 n=1 Tax=Jannaschia pagri TaxID=2829797 RepID=A0ABQ4NLF5_9RHOB|nr:MULTISPECIES: glycosyltransferase [unclassified Jannaschia]GIT91407.1 hypothetical protein JANAI61_18650 [Jannaschia sp. AI_61]GIT95241.1 hypothetical protein JANAI62_18640 [Jannaschia sp. AI_62]
MQISVLTPVYNAAHLVAPFTHMMLGQRSLPDAVIFVDDGSSDGTAAELAEAKTRFEAAGVACHIATHPENRGRGAARLSALAEAKTEMVTWLDIDDYYGPHRIEHLRAGLAHGTRKGSWLLMTPFTQCQADKLHQRRERKARVVPKLRDLYAGTHARTIQLQSLAGPRDAFASVGFDETLNWAEDLDFTIRFLADGGRFVTAPQPQAADVVYVQSFDRTPRDTVLAANQKVYDKTSEMLAAAGITGADELADKYKRYISQFPQEPVALGHGGPGPRLADPAQPDEIGLTATEDGVMVQADGATSHHVGFITGDGGALPLPIEGTLTWGEILTAFCHRAERLRIAATVRTGGEAIIDYRIRMGSDGLIGLRKCADLKSTDRNRRIAASSWQVSHAPSGRFYPTYGRYSEGDGPLFISFFGGADIYGTHAQTLAQSFTKMGVDFEICEFIPDRTTDWTRLCRKKIGYYIAQRRRYGRSIFWVDVDTQLIGDPSTLGSGQDLSGFLRNFHYLPNFDPHRFARLLHPGYLQFGTSPRMDRFLAHLDTVEATAPDNATDDWVLQEALNSFDEHLSMGLFSPDAIVTNVEAARGPGAVFRHTDSGNVADASKTAAQHEAAALSPMRQMAILQEGARLAMRNGLPADAAVFYKRMRKVVPDDPEPVTKLLNILLSQGQMGKYKYHLDVAKANPAVRTTALRVDLDRLYGEGDLKGAAKASATLLKTDDPDTINFVKSRAFRHSFDYAAAEAKIADKDRVGMMWWEQPYPGNLGDLLGPGVVQGLTGIPPKYSKASPRLLSIGSIIRFARSGDTVWGAGASSRTQKIDGRATFRAVRGPLTRDMVLKAGATCPEIYGDPAWFMPILRPNTAVTKTHKLGLIRHFAHADRPLDVAPDVKEIDIVRGSDAEIDAFLEEMLSCEAILSTSLHGVILAQAYGIPVSWAVDSGSARQIHGDGMKFKDYAASVGAAEYEPFDLASVPRIHAGLSTHCTHGAPTPPDLRKLAEAAPFKVADDILSKLPS